MELDNYHSDTTYLTKTMLSTFLDSPRDYYEQYITRLLQRKATTQEMAIGTVCHSVLLQDVEFDDAFVVYPESCLTVDGKLNWRPARAFRESHPNAVAFGKEGEDKPIRECLEAIRDHALGKLIAQADSREEEVKSFYTSRGIKCRPDFHCADVIYDLKFMEDVSDSAIRRSFKRFRYWLQDAHYSACAEAVGFRFWCVETKYPYRIKSVVYDDRSREIAREKWEKTLDAFIECERTNTFEDVNAITLTLSPWDVGADMEGELVEIGEPGE